MTVRQTRDMYDIQLSIRVQAQDEKVVRAIVMIFLCTSVDPFQQINLHNTTFYLYFSCPSNNVIRRVHETFDELYIHTQILKIVLNVFNFKNQVLGREVPNHTIAF